MRHLYFFLKQSVTTRYINFSSWVNSLNFKALPCFNCVAVVLISMLSFKLNAETFEQAYSPIAVGDITIFIPIDRQPEIRPSLAIKVTDEGYLLAWDTDGATRFKLEYLDGTIWVSIDENITSGSYLASFDYGSDYRVSACDIYGCSDWRTVNNQIQDDVKINRFSKSVDAVGTNRKVTLSWDVDDAVDITISSNQGHNYSTYIGQSRHSFSVYKLTKFTLTATDFDQSISQALLVAPQYDEPDFTITPIEDDYIQPLLLLVKSQNLQMQPVERALLSTSITDTSGKTSDLNIVPQHDNKLSRVDNDGSIVWTLVLPGMVANQPLYIPVVDSNDGHLFFNLSIADGTGALCRVNTDGSDLDCLTQVPNTQDNFSSIVAAPLLVDDKLFSVSTDGNVYEVDHSLDFNNVVYRGQLPVSVDDAITTSPVYDQVNDIIVFRTKQDVIIGYSGSGNVSILGDVLSWLGLSEESEEGQIEEKWKTSLSQEEN